MIIALYNMKNDWFCNVEGVFFISVFNQLDAQNLFHNKFYFMPLHVSSTCAYHQEVKIALYSLWYHHTYRWPYKFCVSSWLNTEINILRCTVSKTSKEECVYSAVRTEL